MTNETETELHARLIAEAAAAGVTVEDYARAWASMDGRRDKFDACKADPTLDRTDGHYMGYLAEAEEVFRRATGYARERKT